MGKDAPKAAVTALTKVLTDADVRVNAVQALGEIGPDAKSAVDDIKSAMNKKKDRAFNKAATDALKKIESPKP
jgi:HEAT repeat protein